VKVSREVRAAIGDVVIETTWIEYLVAKLATMADEMDGDVREAKIRALMSGNPAKLFESAHLAAEKFGDSEAASRTQAWLTNARRLREMRHSLVHSIVAREHVPGFTGYRPKGEQWVQLGTRQVVDLARQFSSLSEEGTYMSLFAWPSALGMADSRSVRDGPEYPGN